MKEWLSVSELAELEGKTERAIRKAIMQGRYIKIRQVNGKGCKGKVWQIHISDPAISEEARMKFYKNPAPVPCTAEMPSSAGTAILQGQVPSACPPCPSEEVSEKARQIALARVDLVVAWRQYRQYYKGKKPLTELDREFETAYNQGGLLPGVFEVLGEVSIRTIRRWDEALEGGTDWTRVVPQWFVKDKKEPGLTPEEKAVFSELLLRPGKMSVGSAIRLTKWKLERDGVGSPSSSMKFRRWAEWFKKEKYDLWVLAREGEKALRDKVEPFIRRDPGLLEVGQVLVADGYRLNFRVINPFTGRPCRAVLVGYLDWKSWDIAGYEIMVEESTQCIASALRNAILRLGKIPQFVYMDNGKAFRARFFTGTESFEEAGFYGLFGRLGIIPVFAQPYNARAKVIERWFKEFLNTFERLTPSYVGTSPVDKPAYMMRNEKVHKALHREYVPTIEEVVQWIEAWLEFYRSQPCPHVKGKTIGEVFEEGRGPGVNPDELDELMMAVKKARVGRNGIRLFGAEYYNEELYGWTRPVVVRYSLFDLSYIKVYDDKGRFLCRAERRMPVNPMAPYLGDVKDIEELKQRLREQRALVRQTKEAYREFKVQNSMFKGEVVQWEKVLERVPRVVDEIEEEGLEVPSLEMQIPEEATTLGGVGSQESEVRREKFKSQNSKFKVQDSKVVELVPERPTFQEEWQRYEWHLKFGIHSEADRKWVEYYESTEEWRLLYGDKKRKAAFGSPYPTALKEDNR